MMRTQIQNVILMMVVSLSLLTGCKSSRDVVEKRSYDNDRYLDSSESSEFVVSSEDYAKKVSEPMGQALISEAQRWLGTKYRYGGESKKGVDCSGLVMKIYGSVCGVKLPRTTREQVRYCTKVARNKIKPGDLVFFASSKSEDKVSHVGLYIGDGRMIHASSSRGVVISDFDTGYWAKRYFTGAKVENAEKAFAHVTPSRKSDVAPNTDVLSNAETASQRNVTDATTTIDLLDLIINQKVDSIVTNQLSE